jgi:hypothetical protein
LLIFANRELRFCEFVVFLHFTVCTETAELLQLQKLSLDSKPKALEIPEPNKKVNFLFTAVHN